MVKKDRAIENWAVVILSALSICAPLLLIAPSIFGTWEGSVMLLFVCSVTYIFAFVFKDTLTIQKNAGLFRGTTLDV